MNELTITPGFYKHWKGQIYYVSEVHIRRDTAPFVVYSACYGDNFLYTRPVSEWFDIMGQKENGEPLYRFEKIKYEVARVRYGKWINGRCSECEIEAPSISWDRPVYDYDWDENLRYSHNETHTEYLVTNYCPNCGAKMNGE